MIRDSTLDMLEFPKLLRIISEFSHSEATKKLISHIRPFSTREDIERQFALIREIRRLSHEGEALPLSDFSDISPLIEKIRPEDAILEPFELAGFIVVLRIALSISELIQEREDTPFLKELMSQVTGHPNILRALEISIDSEGNVLDSASLVLSDLRKRIRGLENRIRKKLEEIVRDKDVAVFLQDDFITKRAGRWVIPVRIDSKGMVDGVVHDVSKSGETAFTEPLSIISLANKLENLIAEERVEVLRILRHLCSRIRMAIDEISGEFETIVSLDLLNSVARFSDTFHMEIPLINEQGTIDLIHARHPLLSILLQKKGDTDRVVPLDVSLGDDSTVMVITGPNAGGKTVGIKTIGLLLIMALSGVAIPADPSSSIPLIENLQVDIGDEQSIENNLSTFSAHISNISDILRQADGKSLVLIDELGTGTDPEEGTAIACAVLTELGRSGSLVFATTHLMGIKGFVQKTEHMLNASMEFDENTLTPLYRLSIGEPGQSYAIEVAQRYGLPDNVVRLARGMLGTSKIEFDNLIAELNRKKREYLSALEELKEQQGGIQEKSRHLEERLAEAEIRQKEFFAKAYREAGEIVSDTKRRMYAFLDELKKKGKGEGKKVIKKLDAFQADISQKMKEYSTEELEVPEIEELNAGDTVFVSSLGYDAPVVGIDKRNNRIKVRAGSLEIDVPMSDIQFKKGIALDVKTDTQRIDRPEEVIPSRLNIVGLRVDEALSQLEPFLNHTVLGGLREVTVIHGIGQGILLKAVREYLTGHPLVRKFRAGGLSEGGEGVTVVTLG